MKLTWWPKALWRHKLRTAFLRRAGLVAVCGVCLSAAVAIDVIILRDRGAADELFDLFFAAEIVEGEAILDDLYRIDSDIADLIAGPDDETYLLTRIRVNKATARTRLSMLRQRVEGNPGLSPVRLTIDHMQAALDASDGIELGPLRSTASARAGLKTSLIEARVSLNRYRDSLRWQQQLVLREQTQEAEVSRYWLAALLTTVMTFTMISLLLLRRELTIQDSRRRAEQRAEFLAYFDPLTELANRTRFGEELADRIRAGEALTLVYLDLDDFKGINDTHGHAAGDLVLSIFAARLNFRLNRIGGVCARLGGDEFAAILPGEDAEMVATALKQLLIDAAVPIDFEGSEIRSKTSIGAVFRSDVELQPGEGEEALLAAADFALYAAKNAGRGVARFYNASLAAELAERRSLLARIPVALEAGEFCPAFQPKVDLRSEAVIGFEALIRWRQGTDLMPPASFLPLAEQSGLILELDRHILRVATRQVAQWNAVWQTGLSVSVNLSTGHFRTGRIIEDVEAALEASGLEPWLLTLEITESVLIDDWRHVEDTLAGLKALGVLISLDDFGTGFSSLAYLRRIAADELKIDRDFIVDIEHSEETRFILDAIVDMAHTMHMCTLVEGVESAGQAELARDFGCRQGQGYYWSKPLMPEEVEREILPGVAPPHIPGSVESRA